MEQLTMGRLARQVNVNPQTIRYYEREGLLATASRLASGYRVFAEESVRRVQFIKRAQTLGFSLGEIKQLLSLRQGRTGRECAAVKRLAGLKISEVDDKIRALLSIRTALKELENQCPGSGPLSGCPIVEAMQHDEPASAGPKGK